MDTIATSARTVPWPGERTIRPASTPTAQPTSAPTPRRRCTHIRLQIVGLTGMAEAVEIERELLREAGVIHAAVNPDTRVAYVIYDHDRVRATTLRQTIEQAGFGAETI